MNCNIYRTNSSPLMCLCPFYNLLLYGYTKHKICQWIKLSLVTSHTKCSTSCGLGPFTWADGVEELSYVAVTYKSISSSCWCFCFFVLTLNKLFAFLIKWKEGNKE